MLRPAIILACIYSFLGSHLLAGDPITIDTFVLQFDGTDDRVTVPYDASFPTEVFTASARIKLPQPAGRAAIIARGEDDNSFNLSWQLYVTRDDAGALALYIDGEMRASCEGTGIPSSNNFQDLSIGSTFGTIGPPLGGVEPLASGLVGYWTFNEGTGQVVADLSPAGNDGFLGESPDPDSADPLGVNGEVHTSRFAQFADGTGLFSQIVLFNLDPGLEANVTLVLRDNEGNPLSVDLNGEQVNGQMTALIPAGGLRRFRTDGLGNLVTGSVRVTSDRPVAGVVLFGGTVGLAGVDSSVTQPTGFVAPIETNTGSEINTGIAVMNLEGSSVDLTLELADGDGTVVASAQAVLSALGHLATSPPDFSWSPEVDLSDFESTVKVSSTGPIAGTVIQTRPGQLATLPVVPFPVQPAQGSNTELNFAQFADGDGLFSQIILLNLDPDLEADVTLVLRDDEGNLLTVDLNGEEVSGQMTTLIPAGGLRRFKTDGLGNLVTGSVRVTSDRPVAGVVLFGGTVGLAGVDSSVTQPTGFVAPIETNTGSEINTGIAVMNLEDSSVDLTLQLANGDGAVLASAQAVLSGLGHLATFLPDFSWSPEVNFCRAHVSGRLKTRLNSDGLRRDVPSEAPSNVID